MACEMSNLPLGVVVTWLGCDCLGRESSSRWITKELEHLMATECEPWQIKMRAKINASNACK